MGPHDTATRRNDGLRACRAAPHPFQRCHEAQPCAPHGRTSGSQRECAPAVQGPPASEPTHVHSPLHQAPAAAAGRAGDVTGALAAGRRAGPLRVARRRVVQRKRPIRALNGGNCVLRGTQRGYMYVCIYVGIYIWVYEFVYVTGALAAPVRALIGALRIGVLGVLSLGHSRPQ